MKANTNLFADLAALRREVLECEQENGVTGLPKRTPEQQEAAVTRMAARWEAGEDLETGDPLQGKDADDWLAYAFGEGADELKEKEIEEALAA